MKRIILTLSIILVCGCETNMSPQQRQIWAEAWKEGWQGVNENYQRQLDRQAYGQYPKIIYPNQQSSEYWQERQAEQQYWDNYRRKYNLRPQ